MDRGNGVGRHRDHDLGEAGVGETYRAWAETQELFHAYRASFTERDARSGVRWRC